MTFINSLACKCNKLEASQESKETPREMLQLQAITLPVIDLFTYFEFRE
jgi:hypothetical protein